MLRCEAGQSLWSHPRGGARDADLRQPNPLPPFPQDPDERRTAYYRALEEERHVPALIPERHEPIPDTRPAATASFAPYLELNPELEEALEIDYPGLSRRRTASPV
jgi:hypothetical protein